MTNRNNIEDWLIEQDIPAAAGQPDQMAGGPPASDAFGGQQPPASQDPNIAGLPDQEPQQDPTDISQDPQTPDMPDAPEGPDDFEQWKDEFLKESIKGDVDTLMMMVQAVRDIEGMQSYQRKFIDDNWNILLLRQDSNISKASSEIRKLVKEQLDRNNPASTVVGHLWSVLEQDTLLNGIFVKLNGYGSSKADLHRKFIAALMGSVQVGGGGDTEDIVFNEREYSIMLSTRFNSRWGDVPLGNWSIREDDPERYLSESELKKLQEGSPEEREVMMKRVVMESISKQFETRGFIINVTSDEGAIFTLGWDLATSLRSAYSEGKMIIKFQRADNSESVIGDDLNLLPAVDLKILWGKETGMQDEDGMPEVEHIEFLEKRNGMLFLSASMQTIREAAPTMQGASFKEVPYNGNPSDLQVLRRCVYTTYDLLMKQCY